MIASTSKSSSPAILPATKEQRSKKKLLIGIGAVVMLALVSGIWAIVARMEPDIPRLNEKTAVLAKFVNTKQFDSLPFEQQRQYMKVLDQREQDLSNVFEQHQITESEFRNALEQGWLGKHLARAENFRSLAPGAPRNDFLKKLLDKKTEKIQKPDKARKHPHVAIASGIKVDEAAAEVRTESWPPDVRAQWMIFHNAYHDAKKAREQAEKDAKSGKLPQTQPAN